MAEAEGVAAETVDHDDGRVGRTTCFDVVEVDAVDGQDLTGALCAGPIGVLPALPEPAQGQDASNEGDEGQEESENWSHWGVPAGVIAVLSNNSQ